MILGIRLHKPLLFSIFMKSDETLIIRFNSIKLGEN